MKPSAFSYHRPRTLDEALDLLAAHADSAKVLAGGQSLVPLMNTRFATPAEIIDINDLPDLGRINETSTALELGALVRHHELADSEVVKSRCPLLALAAASIGHYVIRQRGTLGGSLAHADPAAQLPLAAMTLETEIDVASRRGTRTVRAADFFIGIMTTALEPDEVIVAVRAPAAASGEGAAFEVFSRRHGDFAIVAAAVTVTVANGRIAGLRLGIGGVAPIPLTFAELCRPFIGEAPVAAMAGQLGRAVRDAVEPEDNPQIPAEYRRELAETLTARAVGRALARAQGSKA